MLKKLIFFYFKLSFSRFAKYSKLKTQILKKLKTQTQTQTFEYFWVLKSGIN